MSRSSPRCLLVLLLLLLLRLLLLLLLRLGLLALELLGLLPLLLGLLGLLALLLGRLLLALGLKLLLLLVLRLEPLSQGGWIDAVTHLVVDEPPPRADKCSGLADAGARREAALHLLVEDILELRKLGLAPARFRVDRPSRVVEFAAPSLLLSPLLLRRLVLALRRHDLGLILAA